MLVYESSQSTDWGIYNYAFQSLYTTGNHGTNDIVTYHPNIVLAPGRYWFATSVGATANPGYYGIPIPSLGSNLTTAGKIMGQMYSDTADYNPLIADLSGASWTLDTAGSVMYFALSPLSTL